MEKIETQVQQAEGIKTLIFDILHSLTHKHDCRKFTTVLWSIWQQRNMEISTCMTSNND